jgi:hypothetical protein
MRTVRLTDRDRELLAFAAEHRLILAEHAGVLLRTSTRAARARLGTLSDAEFLHRRAVFEHGPRWHQITRRGLAVIDSPLPPPRQDLRSYDHDVGVAWLWLAARFGAFGPIDAVLAERRLRSHDAGREAGAEPFGVRLGGFGPRGGERLHYPDLLLRTADGGRLALELELSPKGRERLEMILAGYGADRRIDRVVYLIESRAIARRVKAAAREVGVADLVYIQPVTRPSSAGTAGAAVAARRSRGFGRPASGRRASARAAPAHGDGLAR